MTNRRTKKGAIEANSSNKANDRKKETQKRCPSNTRCKFCGTQFNTIDAKAEHEGGCEGRNAANVFITLDGKAKFLCKICNQLFKYQSGLKKHELRHQPPGGFQCSECNESFISDAERCTHKELVHKLFKCLICEAKFKSDEEYSKHIADNHDGKDRDFVVCSDCGAQFRQPNQLRLHNESKCGTIRCFSCEQCGSKFMTQNTLNAHLLIHVGEKKYLCNFCGNSYLSRGQLKVHERSHTGEKPFKCDVCGKSFAHRESLVTHSSLHTGVKPYFCENCASRFSCIGNLIKHRRARPQSCGLPQFCKNTKCAPRASSKNTGSLTIKKVAVTKQNVASRGKALPNSTTIEAIIQTVKDENEVTETETSAASTYLQEETKDLLPQEADVLTGVNMDGDTVVYDGNNFISYEVSAVEEINEYSVEDSWQTENVVQDTNQPVFTTNPPTITLVVIKSEQPSTQQEFALPNYDELQIQDMDDFSEDTISAQVDDVNILSGQDQDGNHYEIIEECLMKQENNTPEKTDAIRGYNSLSSQDLADAANEFEDDGFDSNSMPNDDEDYNPEDFSDTDSPSKTKPGSTSELDEFIKIKENKMFQCAECPGQFLYRRSYLKHMEHDHNKTEGGIIYNKVKNRNSQRAAFVCRYCDKKYISEKLLMKHIVNHGDDGTLIHRCTCCPTYFATLSEAKVHQLENHKDKLTCSFCNKMFKDPECLGAHVRYVHTKKGSTPKKYSYVCTKCGKKFNSRVAMSDHERADCGRSPIYKCNSCDKFYHSAGSLKTHQLIHSGNMPHLCNYCGKAFRTQGQVKVHERSHNGDKPYKCQHCPKSFGHRESLMTHLSLHTGIKRFMCQGCSSRFSCISNLQAHRRSHKTTCGLLPNMTKAVGPMGDEKFSACATKPEDTT